MLAVLVRLYNGQICGDRNVENYEKHVGHSQQEGMERRNHGGFCPVISSIALDDFTEYCLQHHFAALVTLHQTECS